MSKRSIDLIRHARNGPTVGTRWRALFLAPPGYDPAPVQAALQASVDAVDAQMSTWKRDSDVMRLNASPVGEWRDIAADLARVPNLGLAIGRASGGALDIGQDEAVRAWGSGPNAADTQAIHAAMQAPRRPANAVRKPTATGHESRLPSRRT
jgi:thiamine biosynthesis lipoprotein